MQRAGRYGARNSRKGADEQAVYRTPKDRRFIEGPGPLR